MLKREYRYPFFEGVPEKTYSTPFFTLRYRTRDGGNLRLAVVVSKKVEALSSRRHIIKRMIMDVVVESLGPDFAVPYDIVVYTKKEITKVEVDSVKRVFDQAFSEIFNT